MSLGKMFNLFSVAMSPVNPEETIPSDLFEKLQIISFRRNLLSPQVYKNGMCGVP